MQLQEVFQQLTVGEFSKLSIGGANQGVIDASNYLAVLSHINLGLTALYTRFTLKEGRLVLALQDGQETYQLRSKFAVSNDTSLELVRYIVDTEDDPFIDDLLKVERVLLEDGHELGLNDLSDMTSVSTPSARVLRVPLDTKSRTKSNTLTVVYRANHPKLLAGAGLADPDRDDLALPDSHLLPLLYFVASRVNNPIGMTNEFHAGNSYATKYELACQELEGKGLQVDQGSQNDRLYRNGWV